MDPFTEHDRQAWNDAVASGDDELIGATRSATLARIFAHIMDDPGGRYADAGWTTVAR